MGEKLIEQLPQIIWASAALLAALTTFLSMWRGHTKLDAIEKKVDGGMTELMKALADIAKQAQASAAAGSTTVVVKEGQRATNGVKKD